MPLTIIPGSTTRNWGSRSYRFAADGSVDDKGTFDEIIAGASANGGTFMMEPGTYRVASNLTIPKNIHLAFMHGAQLKPDNGVTITYQGPQIQAGRQQIFTNASAGQGTISFAGSGRMEKLLPEWWGAKADVGESNLSGTDSTPAIQACFDAATRTNAEFTVTSGVLTSGQRSMLLSDPPWARRISFCGVGVYLISDTINIITLARGLVDGNGAILFWNGSDPTKQMFRLQNCREYLFRNFLVMSHPDVKCMAAFTTEHTNVVSGPHITPTNCRWEDITIRGNNGGFLYGYRGMVGSAGDNNNEFHSWVRCNVYDVSETCWSIEHSQAKAYHFYDCNFNGANAVNGLRRGVSLCSPAVAGQGNGSFYWFGGSGGGASVAAFEIGEPLETTVITGANLESCGRLLSTPFNEVIAGLLGTVPSNSLTMSTPSGSAWVGATPTLVTNAGFSFTYTASRDTYDDLQADGSIIHTAVVNGAAVPTCAGTRLQKVVTDGSKITAVLNVGGSYRNASFISSTAVVSGCRISSGNVSNVILPYTGELIAWMQAGSLTLIGNRYKQRGGGGGPDVARIRYLRTNTGTFDAGKITSIGDEFVDTSANTIITFEQRLLPTNTDESEGSLTDRTRYIALNTSFMNQGGGGPLSNLDVIMPTTSWMGRSRLTGLGGLSGSNTPPRNLSGTITISDTDTTGAVTLPNAEDDALYFPLLQVIGGSGAVIGAPSVQAASLSTSGFTVVLSAPPGVGKSVTVGWMLMR